MSAELPDGFCPYVGLQPYGAEERPYFFGREKEISVLLSNLYGGPLTILQGPSGAGKSSVLGAGVIPNLEAEPHTAVVDFRRWSEPGFLNLLKADCVSAIAAATGGEAPNVAQPLDDLLKEGAELVGGPVVVLLDQFEEYLLYHEDARLADSFEAEFARSVNRPDIDAAFLIVIREDWLFQLERFRIRIPDLLGNVLELRRLSLAAAETAIRGPLAVYRERYGRDVTVENQLVARVLDEVRTGSVIWRETRGEGVETPFLQLVMKRIWAEEAADGSRVLRLSTLERLGGARLIVSSYLKDVMDAMPQRSQDLAARMFAYLVTPSATKIAQKSEDLAAVAHCGLAEAREILETLTSRRILCRLEQPERYEVFHDALAPSIVQWRIRHEQIQESAQAELRAEEQRERAEREAQNARRQRWISAALAVALLGMAVAVTLYVRQQRAAVARDLAAFSIRESQAGDPELALLLALYAWGEDPAAAIVHSALDSSSRSSRIIRTMPAPTRPGHVGAVQRVELAGAKDELLTVGQDGTARFWNSLSGASALFTPRSVGRLTLVRANGDGTRLAAAGDGGATLGVYDRSGYEAWKSVRPVPIVALAISGDGGLVAGVDQGGTLTLWNGSGDLLRSAPAHPDGGVRAVEFTADATRVATAGDDGVVKVWPTATLRDPKHFIAGDALTVYAVAFSPNGERLFAGSEDGLGRVWDLTGDGKTAVNLVGHSNIVTSGAFSPDGRQVATGSRDRTIRVWDASLGRQRLVIRGDPGVVTGVVFTADGRSLATSSTDGSVRLWDARLAVQSLTTAGSAQTLYRIAFNSRRPFFATASMGGLASLWDAGSLQVVKTFQHPPDVAAVAFSADGERLATAGVDRSAKVWNIALGAMVGRPLPHPLEVVDVAFSSSGQLATACWDGIARIWDPGSAVILHELKGHTAGVTAVAYSPDGRRLATASLDSTARVWDAASGRDLVRLEGHKGWVIAIAVSPDGKLVATASVDNTAALWDAQSGKRLHTFSGHTDWVTGVAFSRGGTRLATAGRDGQIRMWDVKTGEPAEKFDVEGVPINSVAFDPDGRRLAVAGEDGAVRFYPLDTAALARLARARVTRNLTTEECRQFLHRSVCRLPAAR